MKKLLGLLLAVLVSCSSAQDTAVSVQEDGLAVCPASDAVAQNVASLAFNLMRQAAAAGCGDVILAPQMYVPSGDGIIFNPELGLATESMKLTLAAAQEDPSIAKFLAAGLAKGSKRTFAKLSKGFTAKLAAADYDVQPWCGNTLVSISTGDNAVTVTAWDGSNSKATPWTPFNGDLKDGNPFLFVTRAGEQLTWSKLLKKCELGCGDVTLDPTAYVQPEAYYYPAGTLMGTMQNPFVIVGSELYADPAHKDEWATRWVNGIQEWGQFSIPYYTIAYKYIKRF